MDGQAPQDEPQDEPQDGRDFFTDEEWAAFEDAEDQRDTIACLLPQL